jgi:hypothetical protein
MRLTKTTSQSRFPRSGTLRTPCGRGWLARIGLTTSPGFCSTCEPLHRRIPAFRRRNCSMVLPSPSPASSSLSQNLRPPSLFISPLAWRTSRAAPRRQRLLRFCNQPPSCICGDCHCFGLSPAYRGPYSRQVPGSKYFILGVARRPQAVSIDNIKPHLGPAPVSAAPGPHCGCPPKQQGGL